MLLQLLPDVNEVGQRLAQEYSTAAPTDTGTKYLTTDALGSTRLITTSAGTVRSEN